MENNNISLTLSHAEALVLFEWLARNDESQAIPIEHSSEQTVLWLLEGQLEKALSEPFATNYEEIIEKARDEVMRTH